MLLMKNPLKLTGYKKVLLKKKDPIQQPTALLFKKKLLIHS